jgi:hypothetical protein
MIWRSISAMGAHTSFPLVDTKVEHVLRFANPLGHLGGEPQDRDAHEHLRGGGGGGGGGAHTVSGGSQATQSVCPVQAHTETSREGRCYSPRCAR